MRLNLIAFNTKIQKNVRLTLFGRSTPIYLEKKNFSVKRRAPIY